MVVRTGEPVVSAIGAAIRDALQFDDADTLRVDRAAAQHLGFGHGVHHCLGAALARLPGLHLAADVTWKTRMLVRGPRDDAGWMVTMTWHVNIDKTACMGTGMCAGLAPELFQLDDMVARPVATEIGPTELALDAADQCPTQAILVTENGQEIGPRP